MKCSSGYQKTDIGCISKKLSQNDFREKYLCKLWDKKCNTTQCESSRTFKGKGYRYHVKKGKTQSSFKYNSSFIVICYWWGSGKLEKNYQTPCVFLEYKEITRAAVTYNKIIQRLIKSCEKYHINYYIEEIPSFNKINYQKAINYKPFFIKRCLKKLKKPVVYVDADIVFRKYPYLFNNYHYDFMIRNKSLDPMLTFYKKQPMIFHPLNIDTSGGVMYFNNTFNAHNTLNLWIKGIISYPKKADDSILAWIIIKNKLLFTSKILFLPPNYLWMTNIYEMYPRIKNKKKIIKEISFKVPRREIIIEHPDCETPEIIAGEKNNDPNIISIPFKEDQRKSELSEWIDIHTRQIVALSRYRCHYQGITIKANSEQYYWEYLVVSSKQQAKQLSVSLHYLPNYISYDKKYGPWNIIVNKISRHINQMNIKLNYYSNCKSNLPLLISFDNKKRIKLDQVVFSNSQKKHKILWAIKKYNRPIIFYKKYNISQINFILKHYHHTDIMMKKDENTVFINPNKISTFLLYLWDGRSLKKAMNYSFLFTTAQRLTYF